MMLCIDEVLNEAIMTSTPYLIVEGTDDVAIYENLAKTMGMSIEVAAVETLAESRSDSEEFPYTEGCEGVKKAIEDLNELSSSVHDFQEYILGIIDRDVREYRNELPNEPCLLVLSMYSIESHFVCKTVFDFLLDSAIAVNREYLSEKARQVLFSKTEEELLDLYYFSLESLKKAIDSTYSSDFQYSYGVEARKQQPKRQKVLDKANDLDQLAAQLSLCKDMPSLRKIAKGKWLYEAFCRTMQNVVARSNEVCGNHDAVQCQFCRVGKAEKCLYGIKDGVTSKTLHEMGLSFVATPNLDYVRSRMALLTAGV